VVTDKGVLLATNGTTLTLADATVNAAISTNAITTGATLDVATVGLTQPSLKGTGTVVLSDSSGNLIAAPAAGTTLTNSVTISGAGAIGNAGDGNLTLVNKGTVDATGVNALTIDTGNAVSNTGTLEATGGAGSGGLIVDDNVSGTGKALIASASKIELVGTLNTAAVTFGNNAGDTGLFVLDHAANPDASHGFHGTIAGFLRTNPATATHSTSRTSSSPAARGRSHKPA
jgi:hypothetical protein